MNCRERFLAVMQFEKSVRPPRYEFGFWVQTVRRWHKEGLAKIDGVRESMRAGDAIGSSLVSSLEESKFSDVQEALDLDKPMSKIPVKSWIFPKFEQKVLEELDDGTKVVVDEMGIAKRIGKGNDSIPEYHEWPVKGRQDWERLRAERLDPHTPGRYPEDFDVLSEKYRDRDFPLTGGGYPLGFFGSLRFLMGEVRLLTSYYDSPQLIKDIISYLVQFWIELYSPVLSKVKLDCFNMWEDMCYKTGPLISPRIFREFMLPAYRKFTSFLRGTGVEIIMLDTDGNCWELVPLFIEAGVTCIFPMEVAASMDVVQVRKAFPGLQIIGGIDKMALTKDRFAIDIELESKIPFMLARGGYIPTLDHHVPPDVPLDNFVHYRRRLEKMLGESGE